MSVSEPTALGPYRRADPAGDSLEGLPARYSSYAGVLSRGAALIVDYLVLVAAWVALTWFTGEVAARGHLSDVGRAGLTAAASFVMAALYFAALEGSRAQATLGKLALGLQVADVHGEPIGFARALARFLGKLGSLFVLGVGFLMAVFNDRHRALHDVLTGTVVLKVR